MNKAPDISLIFAILCLCEVALTALKSIKSKNWVTPVMLIVRYR